MTVLTKIATGAAVAAGSPFNGSWTNEQNARVVSTDLNVAGSNTYATAAPGKNQEYASLWPFVFSEIGAGDTINSVSVKVQWKVSTISSVATLQSTAFADNGAGSPDQATALSATPGVSRTSEPTTDTDDTYAATCTSAQLIQGIWIRAQMLRGNSNTAVTGSLDYIQVTVDYSSGPVTTPKAISATAIGTPTLARVTTRFRALSATTVATPTVARITTRFRALAATAIGAPVLASASVVGQAIAATAIGVASISTALVASVSVAATAVGSAALSASFVIGQAVAATAIGVASLATQFIEGVEDVLLTCHKKARGYYQMIFARRR